MARSLNRFEIIGNVGADIELQYGANGGAYCYISIATTEGWKDKQTGEPQERTDWHRVTAFKRHAEILAEHVKKGDKLHLECRVRNDKYKDKTSGEDRWSISFVLYDFIMLGSANGQAKDYTQTKRTPPVEPAEKPEPIPGMDDDIPF